MAENLAKSRSNDFSLCVCVCVCVCDENEEARNVGNLKESSWNLDEESIQSPVEFVTAHWIWRSGLCSGLSCRLDNLIKRQLEVVRIFPRILQCLSKNHFFKK